MSALRTTFVRSVNAPTTGGRVFGPKTVDPDNPEDDACCLACGQDFKTGDFTVLVILGPGDDSEQREKLRDGRAYNAVCVEVHKACAGVP